MKYKEYVFMGTKSTNQRESDSGLFIPSLWVNKDVASKFTIRGHPFMTYT